MDLAKHHPEVAAVEVNRRNQLIAAELNHGIYQMRNEPVRDYKTRYETH